MAELVKEEPNVYRGAVYPPIVQSVAVSAHVDGSLEWLRFYLYDMKPPTDVQECVAVSIGRTIAYLPLTRDPPTEFFQIPGGYSSMLSLGEEPVDIPPLAVSCLYGQKQYLYAVFGSLTFTVSVTEGRWRYENGFILFEQATFKVSSDSNEICYFGFDDMTPTKGDVAEIDCDTEEKGPLSIRAKYMVLRARNESSLSAYSSRSAVNLYGIHKFNNELVYRSRSGWVHRKFRDDCKLIINKFTGQMTAWSAGMEITDFPTPGDHYYGGDDHTNWEYDCDPERSYVEIKGERTYVLAARYRSNADNEDVEFGVTFKKRRRVCHWIDVKPAQGGDWYELFSERTGWEWTYQDISWKANGVSWRLFHPWDY